MRTLEDVFTTGALGALFVDRPLLDADGSVLAPSVLHEARTSLARGKILVVEGPAGVGKTWLLQRALRDRKAPYVWVQCTQEDDAAGISAAVAGELRHETVVSVTKGSDVEHKAELKFGGSLLSVIKAAAAGEFAVSEKLEKEIDVADQRPRERANAALVSSASVLVLDDIHHVPAEAQRALAHQLKGCVTNGVPVAIARMSGDGKSHLEIYELVRNVDLLSLGLWKSVDLESLVRQGCGELNIELPAATIESIGLESVGLPHLAHDICYRLLSARGVERQGEELERIAVKREEIDAACHRVANNRRSPSLEATEAAFVGAGVPAEHRAASEAVASFIVERMPTRFVRVDDVVSASAARAGAVALSKGQVANAIDGALSRMPTRARERFSWDPAVGELRVLDPTCVFYMRWIRGGRSRSFAASLAQGIE